MMLSMTSVSVDGRSSGATICDQTPVMDKDVSWPSGKYGQNNTFGRNAYYPAQQLSGRMPWSVCEHKLYEYHDDV